MTSPHSASPAFQPYAEDAQPGAMTPGIDDSAGEEWLAEAEVAPEPGAGGRAVLGWALAILAAAWLAFSAWSAGLALAGRPLSFPDVAQWTAIATGPLALLGLLWLMFGRTRRRESEAFTRSVVTMRGEARALDGLLAVVRQRIDENQVALRSMADQLMVLGDETVTRLGSASAELDAGARRLVGHGETFDRAANNARVDLGVLLEDLPRAEATARAMAERLQSAGRTALDQAAAFERQVAALGQSAAETEGRVDSASSLLSARLAELESGARATAERLTAVAGESGSTIDSLLVRTSEVLDEIRGGIAIQSEAVTALVDQARAGLGQAGIESAGAMRDRLGDARSSLDHIAEQVARQDESSRHLIASIAGGLAALDEQFLAFAAQGDQRSLAIGDNLARLRSELEAINLHSDASGTGLGELAERTSLLSERLDLLAGTLRNEVAGALGEATTSAQGLVESARAAEAPLTLARDIAAETSDKITSGASAVETQHDRLAALLAAVDTGVGGAERRLTELSAAIDVGKILADDVDDKSWAAYLKGDRGVFTRRAARLIGTGESRSIQAHYEADREFHESVNRYVHDFEAMLRRVTAERDGGPLAVTLMSSDMGKLYAALAPVAGGRR